MLYMNPTELDVLPLWARALHDAQNYHIFAQQRARRGMIRNMCALGVLMLTYLGLRSLACRWQ